MYFEFLIKKFFQSCSVRTRFTPMHDAVVALCMASPSSLYRLATQHFDEHCKRKQTESFLSQPKHTIWVSRHRTLEPKFISGCFSLKAVHNSCKFERLLQAAKFLFMFSFTHTNVLFIFRHLPTEIVIFINVCCQMKCFSGASFSLFRSKFC